MGAADSRYQWYDTYPHGPDLRADSGCQLRLAYAPFLRSPIFSPEQEDAVPAGVCYSLPVASQSDPYYSSSESYLVTQSMLIRVRQAGTQTSDSGKAFLASVGLEEEGWGVDGETDVIRTLFDGRDSQCDTTHETCFTSA